MLYVRYIFLLSFIVWMVNTDDVPLRKYILKQDGIRIFSRVGFIVLDASRKPIYRIESKSILKAKLNLLVEPSKRIIGKSEYQSNAIRFSLLDEQINQWTNGTVFRSFEFFGDRRTILFNGREIFAKRGNLLGVTDFRTESNDGPLLARAKKIFFSFSSERYTVEIYSNDIMDTVYLLAQVWIDYSASNRKGK